MNTSKDNGSRIPAERDTATQSDSGKLLSPPDGPHLRVANVIQDWIEEAREGGNAASHLLGPRNLSLAIHYSVLHHSSAGLYEAVADFEARYSSDCKSATPIERLADTLVHSVARAKNLDSISSQGSGWEVCEFIVDRLRNHGFLYHGFNGNSFDDITQYGLAPLAQTSFAGPFLELLNLLQDSPAFNFIFAKHDRFSTSWARHPELSIDYASRAPEWFHMFIGYKVGGKDRDQSREVLHAKLIKDGRLSPQQRDRIEQLFDSFWDKFAAQQQRPGLAMLPMGSKFSGLKELDIPSLKSEWFSDKRSFESPEDMLRDIILPWFYGVAKTYDIIPRSEFQLVRLPTFQEMQFN